MPRATSSVARNKRKKKVLKEARGQFGARSKLYRTAKNAVERGWAYSYRDRRVRKRDFRRLWIARINAGARQHDLSYSRFISGLRNAGVELNRKVLADLAIREPEAFAEAIRHLGIGSFQPVPDAWGVPLAIPKVSRWPKGARTSRPSWKVCMRWVLRRAVALNKAPSFILTQFGLDAGNVEARIAKLPHLALAGNALGDPVDRVVWGQLPPGYDEGRSDQYPAIYVIQGLTGRVEMWANRTPFGPNTLEAMGALLAEPDMPPVLLVYVDAFTRVFSSRMDEYESLITRNPIFRARTMGVGAIGLDCDTVDMEAGTEVSVAVRPARSGVGALLADEELSRRYLAVRGWSLDRLLPDTNQKQKGVSR